GAGATAAPLRGPTFFSSLARGGTLWNIASPQDGPWQRFNRNSRGEPNAKKNAKFPEGEVQRSLTARRAEGRRGRGRRCGDAWLPDDRQGARSDQHALAEHLAAEGHLPRVRAGLRQEGQRHDRRRPED